MSGTVIFRRAGSAIDMAKVEDWMQTNYYNWTREANYRPLRPKIIVEPYIFGAKNVEDYKIHCVNGEPRMIWVDLDRQNGHKRNLYTLDWQMLDAQLGHPNGPAVPRPKNLEKMLEIARALSQEFNYIRVDLYSDGQSALVGELTSFSGNCQDRFYAGEQAVTETLFGPRGIRPLIEP
jgi:hypothetical protein